MQIPFDRRGVLVAAVVASSMGFIDGSVLSIMTPSIRDTFDADLAAAQWISNAYLLPLSALIMLGGATGDRYGLRNTFVWGIVIFVSASLVSALANTTEMLISARALQGIGAAFMVPGSLAMIAQTYPETERGKAIGTWAAASSLTTLLGPVLGGLFLGWFGDTAWRWIFAINLPLGAIALTLLRGAPAGHVDRDRKPDLVGALLITAALGLVSMAFIGAADVFAANLVIGLAVFAVFLGWEAGARAPMLPLDLFRRLSFSGAQIVTFLIYFCLSAVSFYLPSVLLAGWGASPLEVSAALVPFSLALSILSKPAGALTDKFGPGPVIAGGGMVAAVSVALLGATATHHAIWTGVVPLMTLFGVGISGVAGPISTAVMGATQSDRIGVASATNNAVARVAGMIAVAAMGAHAANVFSQIALPGASSFGSVLSTHLSATVEQSRVAATDAAFAAICYWASGFAAAGAVLSWFTLSHKTRPSSGTPSHATAINH